MGNPNDQEKKPKPTNPPEQKLAERAGAPQRSLRAAKIHACVQKDGKDTYLSWSQFAIRYFELPDSTGTHKYQHAEQQIGDQHQASDIEAHVRSES